MTSYNDSGFQYFSKEKLFLIKLEIISNINKIINIYVHN